MACQSTTQFSGSSAERKTLYLEDQRHTREVVSVGEIRSLVILHIRRCSLQIPQWTARKTSTLSLLKERRFLCFHICMARWGLKFSLPSAVWVKGYEHFSKPICYPTCNRCHLSLSAPPAPQYDAVRCIVRRARARAGVCVCVCTRLCRCLCSWDDPVWLTEH